nr:genetic suppressor element 1-like [Anolis sagrei ordinatus]
MKDTHDRKRERDRERERKDDKEREARHQSSLSPESAGNVRPASCKFQTETHGVVQLKPRRYPSNVPPKAPKKVATEVHGISMNPERRSRS